MKKSMLALFLILCMLFCMTACSSKQPATDTPAPTQNAQTDKPAPSEEVEPIVWKLQTNVNAGTMVHEYGAVAFADLVKEKSGGKLQIEVYAANAIVPSMEITASVGKGVVEMGLGGPSLDVGFLTEAQVAAGLPFAFETARDQYEYWHEYKDGKAFEIMNSAYNEMGVEMVQVLCFEDNYGLMTSFPVNTIQDLTSKQIRATANNGKIMANLGVPTVNIAIPEVYMGLSNGTADGVVMGFSTLDDFQLKEVLDYVVEPPFYSGVLSTFYCNLDAWNSLTPELQQIVKDCAKEASLEHLWPASKEVAAKLYNETIPQAGMSVTTLPDSEVQKLKDASASVWDSIEAASERNGEMMALVKEYLDAKGVEYPGK